MDRIFIGIIIIRLCSVESMESTNSAEQKDGFNDINPGGTNNKSSNFPNEKKMNSSRFESANVSTNPKYPSINTKHPFANPKNKEIPFDMNYHSNQNNRPGQTNDSSNRINNSSNRINNSSNQTNNSSNRINNSYEQRISELKRTIELLEKENDRSKNLEKENKELRNEVLNLKKEIVKLNQSNEFPKKNVFDTKSPMSSQFSFGTTSPPSSQFIFGPTIPIGTFSQSSQSSQSPHTGSYFGYSPCITNRVQRPFEFSSQINIEQPKTIHPSQEDLQKFERIKNSLCEQCDNCDKNDSAKNLHETLLNICREYVNLFHEFKNSCNNELIDKKQKLEKLEEEFKITMENYVAIISIIKNDL